jgi:hypothetical protein
MEWAIHINSPSEAGVTLNAHELSRFNAGAKLEPAIALAAALAEEHFGPVRFTRSVYGNEFCEHLIHKPEPVEEMIAAARENGLEFTLLTPYVSDRGLAKLRPLFELLSRDVTRNGGRSEVVFNDWGVLNLLRRDFAELIPVQGRLMNKSLRDPRITGVYAASQDSGPALVTLRRSNLDCASYADFISSMGVSSVELDNLPQGVDLSFVENRIDANVYIPFGFISTSRVCMAAGLRYRRHDKFQPGAECRQECQTHLLEYAYTNSPFDNRDQKFFMKGNTYFYVHTEAMLRDLFEQARRGLVSRLIFQPRLPMTWRPGNGEAD